VIPADQHVVLVGLMGTGKTSVGRVLADRLGRRLLDSDAVIEERTGRTVRQIFADDGEPAFRALESEVLLEALNEPTPVVIAAAGGVVLAEQNREALKRAAAKVVWLRAEPESLVERVRTGVHRPAIDDDPAGTLRRMHQIREPLYREVADMVISVDGRSVHDVAEAVLR
jgi:shikimate kinase